MNKLISSLALQIKNDIVAKMKAASMFIVEVDSTQDIAVIDQLAVCVRYVLHGKVKVLLKMVAAQKTTREALYLKLKSELDKFQLLTSCIIGCSFDGAANMSGQYNGLQAKLKQDNVDIQYVHCYAHALNLVMTDSTESCREAKDFLYTSKHSSLYLRVPQTNASLHKSK